MLHLRVVAACMAAWYFSTELEKTIRSSAPELTKSDVAGKLTHWGAPAAIGLGTFWISGFFFGGAK